MEITEFIVKACVICIAIRMIAAGPLQLWTYELLEVSSGTSDPNIFDLKGEVVRLGRGKYGCSGIVDFKVDVDDNVTLRFTVERSKYRAGPFTLFPMGMDNHTLSHVANVYYKPLVQSSALKCCINAPNFKDKFKAPLTKRNITCTNCEISTENLPNILMEGYYRVRLLFSGPVEGFAEALPLVETKIL